MCARRGGAKFIRDIKPGEVLCVDHEGVRSDKSNCRVKRTLIFVFFEYIYFARPDSVIDGVSVYEARNMGGRLLARQHPVDADLVIAVPDSGIDAAIGYAKGIGDSVWSWSD